MIEFVNLIIFLAGATAGSVALFFFFKFKREQLLKAQGDAKKVLHDAKEKIEHERREALINLKNELYKKRSEFELEMKRSRIEQQRLQHKYQKKEDTLAQREDTIDDLRREVQQKERDLSRRLDSFNRDEIKLKKLFNELIIKLERLSGVKKEEAKNILFDSLRKDVELENQKFITKMEEDARVNAKSRSIDIIAGSMQRYLADQVTMHSSSVIHLPNEEMKGRIIGKEGRNIKALEMATGMEFVIGDTPEVISISGFNPIRREIAKRALNKLIQDGRINPTRIEETVEKCEEELESNIEEMGQQTLVEFGFRGVHPELVKLIGTLHFRTSYTQNNLVHSKEVAYFARMIAAELGVDEEIAARCGLLHDIGKAVSAEVEGPHAIVGAEIAKKYGEDPIVVNAIASHHEEVPAKSVYGIITHLADAISAARPGARRETLATYLKRLELLEEIANSFDGVKKAYALQAGREIRVIVDECSLDDEKAVVLSKELAIKIEEEVNFPGLIKVTVIREKRSIEFAK